MDFRRRNSRQRRFGLRDPCPPLLPAAPIGFSEARPHARSFFITAEAEVFFVRGSLSKEVVPVALTFPPYAAIAWHGHETYLGQTRSRDRLESGSAALG